MNLSEKSMFSKTQKDNMPKPKKDTKTMFNYKKQPK